MLRCGIYPVDYLLVLNFADDMACHCNRENDSIDKKTLMNW